MRITPKEYQRLTSNRPERVKPVADIDGVMMGPGYAVLVLPLPSSRNAEPNHWASRRTIKQSWSKAAWDAWLCAGQPRFGKIEVHPVLFFGSDRHRDNDNYTNLATKGILDGLKGHLVPDDNSDLLTLQAPEFLVDRGYPRLELHVLEV